MNDELNFTHSGVLNSNGRKTVRVRFERNNNGIVEFAEGILPDCKIDKQEGFSREEIVILENYLSGNKKNILDKAVAISGPMHWFGDDVN